jgi:hypothetical protein
MAKSKNGLWDNSSTQAIVDKWVAEGFPNPISGEIEKVSKIRAMGEMERLLKSKGMTNQEQVDFMAYDKDNTLPGK